MAIRSAGGRSRLNHQMPRSSMRICSSRGSPVVSREIAACWLLHAPGAPETIYGSLFFPWCQPVALERNQIICMDLEAKSWEGDYIWRWTTRVMPPEGSKASPLQFEQSTLGGEVLSPEHLHRIAADYIPQLSKKGLLRRKTFELMDGRASLEEIARKPVAEFPKRFPSMQEALSYAGVVSQEYSR